MMDSAESQPGESPSLPTSRKSQDFPLAVVSEFDFYSPFEIKLPGVRHLFNYLPGPEHIFY